MRLYVDTSALVKLVQQEAESASLRRFLRRHGSDGRVTSTLARTELVRAVLAGGADAVAAARQLLRGVDQIRVETRILDDAATLMPPSVTLRTLDAIHLASARRLGADLRAVVTYDGRMAAAARALGMTVVAPA